MRCRPGDRPGCLGGPALALEPEQTSKAGDVDRSVIEVGRLRVILIWRAGVDRQALGLVEERVNVDRSRQQTDAEKQRQQPRQE